MVQVRRVKDPEQDAVQGEAKVKAEAEWVDLTPQGRAEIVYARNVQR